MVEAQEGEGEEEDALEKAAARMEAMDVGTDSSNAGASEFADLMNMDVSLQGDELQALVLKSSSQK